MKDTSTYKFEIIEHIVKTLDFKTKDEVVAYAKKMSEVADRSKTYSNDIKKAFKDALAELSAEDLTFENLVEIKEMLL